MSDFKWHKYPTGAPKKVHLAVQEQVIAPKLGESRIKTASLTEGVILFWYNNHNTTPNFYSIIPRPKGDEI